MDTGDHSRLVSEIALARDSVARDSFIAARSALFPNGLLTIHFSHGQQTGEAKLRAARMNSVSKRQRRAEVGVIHTAQWIRAIRALTAVFEFAGTTRALITEHDGGGRLRVVDRAEAERVATEVAARSGAAAFARRL